MYNRLVRHSGKGDGPGSAERAVCLGAIRVGAMAKLLRACAHVYHVECIDLWLASHSTCPLCRCRVGDDRRNRTLLIFHLHRLINHYIHTRCLYNLFSSFSELRDKTCMYAVVYSVNCRLVRCSGDWSCIWKFQPSGSHEGMN
ncbi:hypothetical protein ZWY2020_004868 [Hordeum vulgare]|nr:hypothetical protein ZWY2020_004868 [Hordeum vulgare]